MYRFRFVFLNHKALLVSSLILIAQALAYDNEQKISPCYEALKFHVFQGNHVRFDFEERELKQFSISLNDTYLAENYLTEKCRKIQLRLLIEPETSLTTVELVDSNTDILHQNFVDSRIVEVEANSRFPLRNFLHGTFLGYSRLKYQAPPSFYDANDNFFNTSVSHLSDDLWVTIQDVRIATLRHRRIVDGVFQGVVIGLIVFGNIGIGLNVNWKEVHAVLKRPIGPAIGFCCQFLIMPVTGFFVVKLIGLPNNIALGVFLMGCAPGGGGSNYHTYFLGGCLPLSVTMTFISTLSAFVMIPFWVYTLGTMIANQSEDKLIINFWGIAGALFNSIVPFSIGILINWRRRKLAKKIFRVFVRPLLLLIFIYMVTAGMVTNVYIFSLMTPRVILAGVCLPYAGFTLGFVIALLLRQGKSIAITIAIETGIQAAGIAITTLMLSLPQPDSDLAIAGPVTVIMFTPVPLWITEIFRGFYLCYKKKRCFIFDSCRKRWSEDNGSDDDIDGGVKQVEEAVKLVEMSTIVSEATVISTNTDDKPGSSNESLISEGGFLQEAIVSPTTISQLVPIDTPKENIPYFPLSDQSSFGEVSSTSEIPESSLQSFNLSEPSQQSDDKFDEELTLSPWRIMRNNPNRDPRSTETIYYDALEEFE